MKAAVVHSFDRPLEIEDVPTPTPETGQVLVRIETSGLCHTDIHAARGEWPVKPSPPFIPGHEGVGIVERVGPGSAYGLEPGMRVALPWLGYACGVCRYCNSGRETLCPEQLNMGYALNGGFAEYAIGYARHVVRVPDGVDPADAAPLTCAGVTTYKARQGLRGRLLEPRRRLRRRRSRPPRRSSTRASPARRSSPSIVEPGAAARPRSSIGAEHVVNPAEEDPVAAIQRLGGADAAIATAATPEPPSSRPSARSRAAARSSASACPPRTTCDIPIFETVLGGTRASAARSSARATTSRRSSSCTAAA